MITTTCTSFNTSYNVFGNNSVYKKLQNQPDRPLYDTVEHGWRYIGKINITLRNLLNAAARIPEVIEAAGQNFPVKVKNLTTHMKLAAIVSVPFSLYDLKYAADKIYKSFVFEDCEGVALSSLSFSLIATDMVDSITTFVSAALAIAEYEPLQILSNLSLPLPIALASMGTVNRTIQITKAYRLNQLVSEILLPQSRNKLPQALKIFIKDQITTTASKLNLGEISEKKKAAILRSAPKEIVDELIKLYEILKNQTSISFTTQQVERIYKSLDLIQAHLQKKMNIELLNIFANLVILTALWLFSMATVGPLPFILIATGFTTRIIAVAYHEFRNVQYLVNPTKIHQQ